MRFHMDRCVSDWMGRMSDTERCVEYLGGIGRENLAMHDCTVEDLQSVCEAKARDFTVDDAHELCAELNEGHERFWTRYNRRLS